MVGDISRVAGAKSVLLRRFFMKTPLIPPPAPPLQTRTAALGSELALGADMDVGLLVGGGFDGVQPSTANIGLDLA